MRFSKYYIPTLKEVPSSAEIKSHALSLRAGLIRKVAAGIYAFLPMGLKVLKKIENIVREELNRAGAIEMVLSVMQPSDLWKKTERWDQYGPEMFRLKDRNQRDFCLGPTHEELITYLAYLDIKSYKDLPVNLYQIQVKFRDEIRPRYGLLRAREFIMKDAYSFCRNEHELDRVYESMYETYQRITQRLGLEYVVVEADTGLIGGKVSHEFIVLAEDGEEVVVQCGACKYSAKQESAQFKPGPSEQKTSANLKKVHTPGAKTIDHVASMLGVDITSIAKSMVLQGEDGNVYAFLLSGERALNIENASKAANTKLELIQDKDLAQKLNLGYFGPVGAPKEIRMFSDCSIKNKTNLVVGANQQDYHYMNANQGRDFDPGTWGSFSYPVQGDLCPECGKELAFKKGIEIGHIFKLGEKYSTQLDAKFLDEDGRQKPFVMGCYGIGISRIMSASIEQLGDSQGIIWPDSLAPFKAVLIVTNMSDKKLGLEAEKVYQKLMDANMDVLYDDRDVRAGVKFKDAALMGIPLRLIMGKHFLAKGLIEIESRTDDVKQSLEPRALVDFLAKLHQ